MQITQIPWSEKFKVEYTLGENAPGSLWIPDDEYAYIMRTLGMPVSMLAGRITYDTHKEVWLVPHATD